ncbi:SGNH/GDSL hydrolase family protein [Arthrobacter sp. Leaf137]|uniref:SGNH/GDSL hydrolase family protein n=1 Tax=Arthrobacter sp. Leaf137 TaxID=1736271 RepID=UPI0006F95527|nr:SGNH/GDSL hydrolase family protein [Arthrobacter sp. Leaf137]KQQ90758.1 hypothetical protein ASF64_02075 [Arthrobacter sp. Leaf137]
MLAVVTAVAVGLVINRQPPAPEPGIDVARAEAANAAAVQARVDRDRAVLEAATVPLIFPADGKPLRVLYSGDSNIAGFYSSTEDKAFRPLVTSELLKSGAVEEVHTYKPGATTMYIRDNFDMPKDIGLAVISLGTNWSREDGGAVAFGQRYDAYLSAIKAANPSVQILCLGIWARTNSETQPFIEELSRTCDANGGRFVDLQALYVAAANLSGPEGRDTWAGKSDASHPNDYGHQAIADEILKRIRR